MKREMELVHPEEILKMEIIEGRGLTVSKAAALLVLLVQMCQIFCMAKPLFLPIWHCGLKLFLVGVQGFGLVFNPLMTSTRQKKPFYQILRK